MDLMKAAFALFAILLMSLSFCASVSGTMYSAYTHEPMDGPVVVEANGPMDYKGVFTGNYSMDLAPGNYSISAYTANRTMAAGPTDVEVAGNTEFDVVLLNIDAQAQQIDWRIAMLAGAIAFIAIGVAIFIFIGKKDSIHERAVEENRGLSEDEERLMLALYQNKGTVEQADLMAQASWSASKAGLIAKDLDAQGYVVRIRDGNRIIIKTTKKGEDFNRQRRRRYFGFLQCFAFAPLKLSKGFAKDIYTLHPYYL
jgi:uncharacterized membrane protein